MCWPATGRIKGDEVFFLTGTDEHGQKVEKAANAAGETPLELADRVMKRFQALWEKLGINYSDFIRTTQERHKHGVADIFSQLMAQGDIYLGEYEDWYCTPCETFWTETQLIDGNCPDCNRPVDKLKEESYFFRMSSYQERLLAHIEANPDFIQPKSKRNEIVSFVKEGLRDLSVSRTTFNWGIPVPGNEKHIIYVWFDALSNYITALGYPDRSGNFGTFWPVDVHLIGKDILRFHAVYWPTFLMAAGLPLPKKVFAHGWWTVEGQKMSKSLQNVVEPNMLIDRYGVDAVRYFLLREVPFGLDGDFSQSALVNRINSDLANDLGNLLNRSTAMINKYFGGELPACGPLTPLDTAYLEKSTAMVGRWMHRWANWRSARRCRASGRSFPPATSISTKPPPGRWPRTRASRSGSARSCTASPNRSGWSTPCWRHSCRPRRKKGSAISAQRSRRTADSLQWGRLAAGTVITKAEALFPRIEERGE